MGTQVSPRRQSKPADKRRQEILDAALRLFHERGFEATTVQGIAAKAGVAAGTVYLYFRSKEHVLQALHSHYHAEMQARLEAAANSAFERIGTPQEVYGYGIDAMVDAVVDYCLQHRRETEVICRFMPRIQDEILREGRELGEFIGGRIRAGVEAGRLEVSDPEMAGQLLTAALREPLIEAIVAGRIDDLPRMAEQAKELFRKALAPTGTSST